MKRTLLLVVAAAGCGDNIEEPTCEPPAPVLPTGGPFADPLELPLPDDCVVGGLRDLPGRWFVRPPDGGFNFSYPLFEDSCATGLRRANWLDEDTDLGDGSSYESAYETWSDGTRFYQRYYQVFPSPMGRFENANVEVVCMLPDGTLAGVSGIYDSDRGPELDTLVGTRFAPRDTGAVGLELVGEVGAGSVYAYNVVVADGYAYVAGALGLDVIDVRDPRAPRIVGHVADSFNDVKVVTSAGTVIAYASPMGGDKTAIIDVTDPTAPVQIGSVPEYSHSVFVTPSPPRLYLATYTSTIPVYDVSLPRSPVRVGGVPLGGPSGVHDLHVAGDRIYANKGGDGFVAVDVAAGFAQPVELGRLVTPFSHASWAGVAGGRQIVIHGDEGMTPEGGAFLRVIDADRTSPTFMTEIGRYQSRPEIGIHNVHLVGDRAYLAYYQDGVRLVDLSDPTRPREIAHYNTWDPETAGGAPFEGAFSVVVHDGLIYVADSERGLVILRAP